MTTMDISSNDPLTLLTATAEGAAVLSNETIQTWIQKEKIIVDIVWIIDNSGSMNPYQNLLGNNIHIHANVHVLFSDFQMAFITTDDPSFVDVSHHW